MSGRRLLLCFAFLFLLPGCAFPVVQKCDGWLQQGGRCIDPETLSFIVPGETTKDDVIRRLGLPTRVLRGATVYGYDWKMASWFVAAPATYSAVKNKQHLLWVVFDERGRVVKHEEREGYSIDWLEIPPESLPSADNVARPVTPPE